MFKNHFVFRLIRRFAFRCLAGSGLCLIFYFVYVAHHNHVEIERLLRDTQNEIQSQDGSPYASSGNTKNSKTEVKRTPPEHEHNHHDNAGHPDLTHVYTANGTLIESNEPLSQESIELYEWIRTGKITPAVEEQLRLHALDKKNVIQRVVSPDGKLHQVIVPRDSQYEEGDAILRSELDPPMLFDAPIKRSSPVVTIRGVDYSVPDEYHAIKDEYAREEYLHKFVWSVENGVSMAEVEKKVEKGELDFLLSDDHKRHVNQQIAMQERQKMLSGEIPLLSNKPPVKVSFLPDEGVNARPGWMIKQEAEVLASILTSTGGDNREILGGESISEDASGTPVRSDVPVSPSDLSDTVKPISPQSVEGIEKQLTPEGIESDLTKGLSADRFDKAQQLIDQYGTEEGLRRLREMDPEAARQFERGHPPQSPREQGEGSRTVPDGGQSESGSKN